MKVKVTSIIFIIFGCLLTIVGYLFKLMHWPDLFRGIYSGPAFFFVGFILLLTIILKKKAE